MDEGQASKREILGYAVAIRGKKCKCEGYELLGYGITDDYPYPDELLRERGGTLFKSKDEAYKKIKEINDSGHEWTKKFIFGICPIHSAG